MTASLGLVLTVTGTTAITIGETAVLTAADNGNGGLLIVQPATLSQQAVLQSLSFYVTAASGKLVLGIYASNSAGLPGAIVAQTAQFTPKVGWNTVVPTTTPTLSPGTYWLCYFPQSNSLDFVKKDGGVPTAYLIKQTFGALPSTYPSGASSVVTVWSLYATLVPTGVAPILSSSNSTFTVVPSSVASGAAMTLTITAKDTNDNPFPDATVSLTASGTSNTFTPSSGTTNSNGVFTATLVSTVAQNETIAAQIIGGTMPIILDMNVDVTVSSIVGSPTLVQMVSWPVNLPGMTTKGDYAVAGSPFVCNLPNPVKAGNTLVISGSWPHGTPPTSISDSVNGAWSTTPRGLVSGGAGKLDSGFFVMPASGTGVGTTTTITVTFASAVIPFHWNIFEWSNITGYASAAPGAANATGPSLTAGSFTPPNNNANGGNLILTYAVNSITTATTGPNPWAAGTNQTLLEADMTGYFQGQSGQPAFSHATEYYLQATSAAINPGITATGDSTAGAYNCAAIALTVGATGSGPPTNSIYVAKVINQSVYYASAATLKMQVPWTGNLRFCGCLTGQSVTWGSLTNSDGYTWVNKAPGTPSDLWMYAQNAAPNTNATTTLGPVTWDSYPNHSFIFLDIANAPAAAYDNFTGTTGQGYGITGVPAITPVASSGLTIAAVALYTGPGTGVTSPTGAVFDFITYPQETDSDNYDNADLFAHYYFNSNAPQSYSWTINTNANPPATQSTFGYYAITFAGPPPPLPGVTYVAIDGETMGSNTDPTTMSHNYFARSGFTKAASTTFNSNYANGWDSSNFFALGPFEEDVNDGAGTSNWVTTWQQLGWGVAFNVDNNNSVDLANMNTYGIYLMPNAQGANGGTLNNLTGIGAETVGWESWDEPPTYDDAIASIQNTPNATQNGRFWWVTIIFEGLWSGQYGVYYVPGGIPGNWPNGQYNGLLLTTPVNLPTGGITTTFSAFACDIYWINNAAISGGQAAQVYVSNFGSALSRIGALYGDQITWERQSTNGTMPIFGFVETGNPSTTVISAATSTQPPEAFWAALSIIIAGGRGIIWFDHTNTSSGNPPPSDNNMYQSYYQTASNYACGYSMYTAVAAADALILAIAPIINSPNAVGYATSNPASTVPSSTYAGLNTSWIPTAYTGTSTGNVSTDMFGPYFCVKKFVGTEYTATVYNVPPYSGGFSVTFTPGFYIIATTRNAESTTNYGVTFTITDSTLPKSTSSTGINVVGENRTRTLTYVSGNTFTFTDTFVAASDVHIYQVVG